MFIDFNISDVFAEQLSKQEGMIGEICIDGVLTYKPVETMCSPSGVSYQGILDQAEELIGAGVKTLILTHSSPGGEASHCFSTANDLRQMCDDNGVYVISYVDTFSHSASLALQVIADEVIIHPSASTGSIGCVVALLDDSKALDQAGLKPIYIASSPGKTAYSPDGSISEEYIAKVQADVSRLGLEFAQHVSKYTGLPVDDITSMNADTYHAQAALEVGLVNKIMDHNQFAAYVAGLQGEA